MLNILSFLGFDPDLLLLCARSEYRRLDWSVVQLLFGFDLFMLLPVLESFRCAGIQRVMVWTVAV